MSPNTKQILAITLGAVGLVIGIFAMITAYNAKQATKSDSGVASQVQVEFADAQKRQDALETKQASDAEKLITSLTSKEKRLVRRLNSNARGVRQLRRKSRNQQSQINSLGSRDREVDNELANQEKSQNKDFKRLNGEIKDLQKGLNKLRNRVTRLEDFTY